MCLAFCISQRRQTGREARRKGQERQTGQKKKKRPDRIRAKKKQTRDSK